VTLRCVRLPLLLAATAAALLAGCSPGTAPAPAPAPSGSGAAAAAWPPCAAPVETGPLPEWARTGFSGDSSLPHVLGSHGDIVAAMFGYPLTANRRDGTNNKILWISRIPTGPGDLVIDATLDGADLADRHSVTGGPGPSIIDLPKAGCWHLTLTWSGHTDTMDLIYR